MMQQAPVNVHVRAFVILRMLRQVRIHASSYSSLHVLSSAW